MEIKQVDINNATGNSNANLNNKVFLDYVDCIMGPTEKAYTSSGYYPDDVCSIISGSLYYYKTNQKVPTGRVYEGTGVGNCCE